MRELENEAVREELREKAVQFDTTKEEQSAGNREVLRKAWGKIQNIGHVAFRRDLWMHCLTPVLLFGSFALYGHGKGYTLEALWMLVGIIGVAVAFYAIIFHLNRARDSYVALLLLDIDDRLKTLEQQLVERGKSQA